MVISLCHFLAKTKSDELMNSLVASSSFVDLVCHSSNMLYVTYIVTYFHYTSSSVVFSHHSTSHSDIKPSHYLRSTVCPSPVIQCCRVDVVDAVAVMVQP